MDASPNNFEIRPATVAIVLAIALVAAAIWAAVAQPHNPLGTTVTAAAATPSTKRSGAFVSTPRPQSVSVATDNVSTPVALATATQLATHGPTITNTPTLGSHPGPTFAPSATAPQPAAPTTVKQSATSTTGTAAPTTTAVATTTTANPDCVNLCWTKTLN